VNQADAIVIDERRTKPVELVAMSLCRLPAVLALSAALSAAAAEPKLPGVGAAMQEMIANDEIAGAVTVVVTKDRLLHLEATGFADVAAKRPMMSDTLFWIASMTSRSPARPFSCCRMRASSRSQIPSRNICPSLPI
jgi:hypothetical protein